MADATFEALWTNTLDHWEEDRAHGAFLSYCQDTDQLAEAAARYRGMAGDPDRGADATRRLSGIALLALARLEATRTRAPRSPRRVTSLVLIACFVAATLALALYLAAT